MLLNSIINWCQYIKMNDHSIWGKGIFFYADALMVAFSMNIDLDLYEELWEIKQLHGHLHMAGTLAKVHYSRAY